MPHRFRNGIGTLIGPKVRGLGLESVAQAAIDQKRFIGSAGIGLPAAAASVRARRCSSVGWCAASAAASSSRCLLSTWRRIDSRIGSTRTASSATCCARARAGTGTREASASSCAAGAAPSSATASAKTTSSGVCGEGADLQREIDLARIRRDLNLAMHRREAEHRHVDSPCAGGHVVEFEIAVSVGQSSEDAVTLSRAHGGAGQRLAFRFHCAGLRQRE